jgi:hypothetical protein
MQELFDDRKWSISNEADKTFKKKGSINIKKINGKY